MNTTPEILIYTPDGKRRHVPLNSDRITLGRSKTADLCYPEDAGLSRLHLAFERTNSGFVVRDLKSKNGTIVNGARTLDAHPLRPNDKISGGHLLIIFEPPGTASQATVVFIDGQTPAAGATIVTTLGGVIDESRKTHGPAAQISALIRAGNELANERPLPELFRYILDLSIDTVGAGRGVLLTNENGSLIEQASRGETFQISTTVRDRVVDGKFSMLVRDTTLDEAFRNRESIIASNVRTLMAVPLQVRDTVIGLIYVDSPTTRREFTRDDLNLLTVMANVAAIRVEHTRLAGVEQARKVMEYELEQAEEIQRSALPTQAPRIKGLEIAGQNSPARNVGGDYYDFFPERPSSGDPARIGVLVADVSGKGMPAALMVMALQARVQPLFETLPVAPGALAEAMNRANRLTTANCPPGMFITVFACVVDGVEGVVDWSCAGHNPPILVRSDGSHQVLRGGSPMMGMFPDLQYGQQQAQLKPGDMLAIYSDGITEACSPDDVEFDVPRLAEVLIRNRRRGARQIVDTVIDCVGKWTRGAPQVDDITLVIVKKVS